VGVNVWHTWMGGWVAGSSPHTLGPHGLVEAHVDADVGGSHLLDGKLADLLDGAGGPLLEAPGGTRGARGAWLAGVAYTTHIMGLFD